MIPQIPNTLLARYATSATKILDPFVGGGSVLVEAYLANHKAIGIDVNPLAVIITRAKTTSIRENALLKILKNFPRAFHESEPLIPDFPSNSQIDYWFKPYMFEPLGRLRAAIHTVVESVDETEREDMNNLMDCIYSNTVRGVSLTYRGEVRLRRLQGADLDNFNPDVFYEFKKRMEDTFARVSQLPRHSRPNVYEGDVRNIGSLNQEYDLVITSPPYGDIKNTIPYHQFSKNMLYWLGLGEAALNRIKNDSLGAKNSDKKLVPSATLQHTVDLMRKPNLIHEAMCFYTHYQEALVALTKVTSQRIIIVIGHRILDGTVIDNPTITTEMMQTIGWRLETRFDRNIRKKRINRKMGFGNNAQGGTIDSEAILVFIPEH
jgi:hypothetical protein